ncbi:MAG: hypothetical protein KIY10_10555 [Thermoplasmata archaeon]|nr:hypothetical protein [Candidatus Sysuiplasma jiujiangense]
MLGEKLKPFERQSSLLRLLVTLNYTGEINFQKLIDEYRFYPNPLYASVDKAKELGIIVVRKDSATYPPKNMISLTQKGKRVAELLKKIDDALN